jgi:hypothetical protein
MAGRSTREDIRRRDTKDRALRWRSFAVISIVALAMSACATGQASPTALSPSPSVAAGAGKVQVTLQERAVVPVSTSVAAGDVTFQVTNAGPADVHEFVVVKTDLDPAALPKRPGRSRNPGPGWRSSTRSRTSR